MVWVITYSVVAFLFFCIRSGNANKYCAWQNKIHVGMRYKPKYFTMLFQSLVWPLWCVYAIIGEIIEKI